MENTSPTPKSWTSVTQYWEGGGDACSGCRYKKTTYSSDFGWDAECLLGNSTGDGPEDCLGLEDESFEPK
jgi:hypothetical protein